MESKLFLEVYEYGPDFDIASTLSEIHHQICQGEWDGLIWVRNATEKSPSGYFLKDHCNTYLNLVYSGSWIWLSRLQRFLVSWIIGVIKKKNDKQKTHATFFKAILCIQLAWCTNLLKVSEPHWGCSVLCSDYIDIFVELNELLECWAYSQHQMQLRNATHILLPQWKCGVASWRKSWSKSSLVTTRQGAYILLWQRSLNEGPTLVRTRSLQKHGKYSPSRAARGDMSHLPGVIPNSQHQRLQDFKIHKFWWRRSPDFTMCMQWYWCPTCFCSSDGC